MKTLMVVLVLCASVVVAQPQTGLMYGQKDLNFNILDHDSLRVWQTERDGHGLWWQDNATKDVFFLRTDTVGLFLYYLDVSAGTWATPWAVDPSGAVTTDSTYIGDLTISDDLIVSDDVTADSVYARTVKTSGAVAVGTTLEVTGASTQDSIYARTVKTPTLNISTGVTSDVIFGNYTAGTNRSISYRFGTNDTSGVYFMETNGSYGGGVRWAGASNQGQIIRYGNSTTPSVVMSWNRDNDSVSFLGKVGVASASTVDSVYGRTIKTSGAVILGGAFQGNDVVSDTAAFTLTELTDTVTVTGAAATDLYIATVCATAAADTISLLLVQPTATGFVMHRTAATAESNQSYFWMRIKR